MLKYISYECYFFNLEILDQQQILNHKVFFMKFNMIFKHCDQVLKKSIPGVVPPKPNNFEGTYSSFGCNKNIKH